MKEFLKISIVQADLFWLDKKKNIKLFNALIEKVDEPFLGKTLIRQKYRRLNGVKSKELYQILIDKFLGN